MRFLLTCSIVLFSLAAMATIRKPDQTIVGKQPNASIDAKGVVRIAFGNGERIYCMTSTDHGNSFSKPVLVAELAGMHLGHTRGPQIASSRSHSMITAIDDQGDVHAYLLDHNNGHWKSTLNVNDLRGSAAEGLMALTADNEDNFYAVWLDTRLAKENNIYSSKLTGNGKWSRNKLVYQSPDGHVCECCKPNIAFNGGKLAVTFRNWLMGSRDIYYLTSADKGESFSAVKKAGTGTWKLDACPMDGGGLSVSDMGLVSTAWQRNGEVFFSDEKLQERRVGSGRDINLLQNGRSLLIAWQANANILVMNLKDNKIIDIGKGSSPKLYALGENKSLCVWEVDDQIRYLSF
jgi:hypothetical protein